MADAENILNNEEFFAGLVDIPKEGAETNRKWECLKDAIISKDKMCLVAKTMDTGKIKHMPNTSSAN